MPLYFRELYGDEGVVEWAKKWGADAIIAQFSDIDLSVFNQLNIPIIVQNYKDRSSGISNLTGDYFGTGVIAANFFHHKGYIQTYPSFCTLLDMLTTILLHLSTFE